MSLKRVSLVVLAAAPAAALNSYKFECSGAGGTVTLSAWQNPTCSGTGSPVPIPGAAGAQCDAHKMKYVCTTATAVTQTGHASSDCTGAATFTNSIATGTCISENDDDDDDDCPSGARECSGSGFTCYR